jgi:hypothetical protein
MKEATSIDVAANPPDEIKIIMKAKRMQSGFG